MSSRNRIHSSAVNANSMDIQRGSRRARHVAANTAASQAAQAQQQQQQRHQHPPPTQVDEPRRGLRQAAGQSRDLHRTPDQRQAESDEEHQMPTVAPPLNPFRLHRSTRGTTTPRLSMPNGSDDASDSELDLSVLAMARGGGRGAGTAEQANTMEQQMLLQQQAEAMAYEDEIISQEQYEAEETSIDGQVEDEEEEDHEEAEVLVDPASIGLKEISNLGKFTVSSHKPGNGVQELRSDDLKLYWQSDGPQPHKLTIYFVKRVGIRAIRFFVDYREDESYTPTKIVFKSGTSENNLIEFATMNMENPCGWLDVPIAGAGGEPDGNTLVSYVLQMQILENHQNGKDTHLRGIKIYAFDPDSGQQAGHRRHPNPEDIAEEVAEMVASSRYGEEGASSGERLSDMARILASSKLNAGESAFSSADFFREPELR